MGSKKPFKPDLSHNYGGFGKLAGVIYTGHADDQTQLTVNWSDEVSRQAGRSFL